MMTGRGALFLSIVSLFACGCSGEENTESEVLRPPVILDEDTMSRLMAALREMQDVSRGHPLVLQAGNSAVTSLPMGPGVTTVLGDQAEQIAVRHGFGGSHDLESKLAHLQLVVQRLTLGEHVGFDGSMQLYQMRGRLQQQEASLRALDTNDALSEDERRLEKFQLKQSIAALHDRIEEVNDIAAALREQSERIPDVSLRAVQTHLEEVISLMVPQAMIPANPRKDR